MIKKIINYLLLFLFFISNIIWITFWSNQETPQKTVEEQVKEISQDKKDTPKTSNTEIIKELAWSEEQEQIKNTENKISDLKDELEKIWISNQSIRNVEHNLKKEIENIKSTIEQWKSIWQLQKENDILRKDLSNKEQLLEELNQEKVSNLLKKQELEMVIDSYKELKKQYENKIQQKRNERIKFILINTLYFVFFQFQFE